MRASGHPTRIASIIERYLRLKRALGRRFCNEEYVLGLLDDFVARESQAPCPDLTPELFAGWCHTQGHLTSTVRRNRMRIVRNLCLYRRRTEPACFVPDKALFPRKHESVAPYIFSEDDVCRLLAEADKLEPTGASPLRRENHRLAIILLFTAGLRRGELVRLTLGDFDDCAKTLSIQDTKFHKSRLVPVSASTSTELISFLDRRRAVGAPQESTAPLLWNRCDGGRAYSGGGLAQGLRSLMRSAQTCKPDGQVPRVHDFRHSFAANALLRWYRAGIDITARLPYLATYMGHVSVVSTQLYVPFADQLAKEAGDRFEAHCATCLKQQPAVEANR